ncbi:unnamed protein product [Phytomonas sp. Hart1]|nr:unnamed protein product [Phytomonas sp. Hart1]|eukprot:CCW66469.1 unnamed protein product [Phytomonas sp. isolate Hart1]
MPMDLDAIIGAALSGNLEVLETAFAGNPNWQDSLWCYLRCFLVVAFTKTLIDANAPVEPAYAAFIEQQVGSDEDWIESFSRKLVVGLRQRVEAQNFLDHVKLEEQLELRFILQMLSMDGGYDERYWFDIRPEVGNPEATRLITHLLLVLDTACSEAITSCDVQEYAWDSLAFSISQYSVSLALLPLYPFEDGLRAMVAMAMRLRNPKHRAQAYTAFVRAVRDSELDHAEMSRGQIEEQEASLVRMFVELDSDTAVRSEVQVLLSQETAGDALLTHNKTAEKIMWEAMHAYTTKDYMAVLSKGLEACVDFWLADPEPELDAITDVSRILMQRVIPALVEPTQMAHPSSSMGPGGKIFTMIEGGGCSQADALIGPTSGPLSAQGWSEVVFWYAFSEARALSKEHAKYASTLGAARATSARVDGNRTFLLQLSQNEGRFMSRLIVQTQRAIRHGGAVVHRSRRCLAAVVWMLQVLVEDVTLSLLNSDKADGLELIQTVFALLEELNEAGYLHPSLLLQKDANALFTCIRAMRITYGQRVLRKHVEQTLLRVETARGTLRL